MRVKKFFMGLLVALGIIILLSVLAGLFFFFKIGKLSDQVNKMPAVFENPAVLIGEGFLKKTILIENSRLGNVTDIVVEGFQGVMLGLVGLNGALFLDSNLEILSSVSFRNHMAHVKMVDVENDGVMEFMSGGSWGEDAAIYNNNGKLRWKYRGSREGVNDLAIGNFDNDNQKEFVVAFNGGGGVHLIDQNGKRVWNEKDGNVWQVEAVDIDNDGISEIIHSNAAGELTVRNAEGNIIKKWRSQSYVVKFSLMDSDSRNVIVAGDDHISLFDFDGNLTKDFEAPHVETFGSPLGTTIQIDPNGPTLYAFSISYGNWKKCNFYLYGEDGKLVYHEILNEACESMATMLDSSNNEVLLLGGHSKVWKYSK